MMTIIHQEENRSNSCGFGGRGSVCRNLFLAASVLDVPANPTAPFALSVPKGKSKARPTPSFRAQPRNLKSRAHVPVVPLGHCVHYLHGLDADGADAAQEVNDFFLVVGEAVGVEAFGNGRVAGLLSLYWSRTHSRAERLPNV